MVVCKGQPLTSRLTCLVLEGDDPGGQIKTPIIPVKKVQGGDNMPYFRPHTVEDLRRSWILDHTHNHLDRISHFLYKKSHGSLLPGQWGFFDSFGRKSQSSGSS